MFCFHCGEPIDHTHSGFAEVHGHESTPICLDCADLYEACMEIGVFDEEGNTEDAFFVDPHGRTPDDNNNH